MKQKEIGYYIISIFFFLIFVLSMIFLNPKYIYYSHSEMIELQISYTLKFFSLILGFCSFISGLLEGGKK